MCIEVQGIVCFGDKSAIAEKPQRIGYKEASSCESWDTTVYNCKVSAFVQIKYLDPKVTAP